MGVTDTIAKLKSYFLQWHKEDKTAHLSSIFPIGSIYMTTKADFIPDEEFGGTWVRIEDCFLLGSGTRAVNAKGGQAQSYLEEHTHNNTHYHSINDHNHTTKSHYHGTGSSGYNKFLLSPYDGNVGVTKYRKKTAEDQENGMLYLYLHEGNTINVGDKTTTATTTVDVNNTSLQTNNATLTTSKAGNVDGTKSNEANMPPYLVISIWKRTA